MTTKVLGAAVLATLTLAACGTETPAHCRIDPLVAASFAGAPQALLDMTTRSAVCSIVSNAMKGSPR